jgi:hypothetical protein
VNRLLVPMLVLLLAPVSPACSQHGASPKPDASMKQDTSTFDVAKLSDVVLHPSPVSVLTQHNDNDRSGANTSETCLTPRVASTLTQRAELHIDGQVYAQPLLLTGAQDLLIVASTANEVAAFDIATLGATPVWQLGPETFGTPGNVVRGIAGPLGILSTPVIDPVSKSLYVVARSCATATTITPCPWTLHVVDAPTGKHVDSTVIATSFKDAQGATHTFNPDEQWNRPALLLQNGTVFVGWEVGQNQNQSETMQTDHGYMMAFDVANIHSPPVTFVTTPNGFAGGVWQGGGGPAGDGTAVYFNSGNSIMTPTPAAPQGFPATPRDYENSSIRVVVGDGGMQATSYYDSRPYDSGGNVFQYVNFYDWDVSSSGVTLIPQSTDLVLGSKSGIVYLLDRATMQQDQAPILPFTANPPPSGQTLHISNYNNGTAPQVMGTPVAWRRASDALVFMWPFAEHLTSFEYSPVVHTLVVQKTSADYGFNGAMLSLSANGAQTGTAVLWANMSTGSGAVGSPAAIRAYDPEALTLVWQATLPGYAKWACPTVSGGRVYVPTWTAAGGSVVYVFGTPACGN